MTLYPAAIYKSLGVQTQPKLVNPRAIIVHTMGGFLGGTDSTFRKNGYTGSESHFGIGGYYDGNFSDGVVWQWQDLDYTADAQFSGNSYGISIETSDGAHSNVPWSVKQIDALESLLIWLCVRYKISPLLIPNTSSSGIGYHSQFHEWNLDNHNCPGEVRKNQLITIVIPNVASRLSITKDVDMPWIGHNVDNNAQWIIDSGVKTYIVDIPSLQGFQKQFKTVDVTPAQLDSIKTA